MKIEWTPSLNVRATMKRVADLKKEGRSYRSIANELGYHRTYIIALFNKYKEAKNDTDN